MLFYASGELNIPLEEVGVGESEMQPPNPGLQDDKEDMVNNFLQKELMELVKVPNCYSSGRTV